MDLDQTALALKAARTPYCRATVVRVEGSAPRRAGAAMLVTGDASFGTVGGGGLEHQAIADAREAMRLRTSRLARYELKDDGIQPCGGAVEIFLEPVLPSLPCVVFGAGHIAEKLCPMLIELGFEVTLVDERPERIGLPAFAAVPHRRSELPEHVLPTLSFDDDAHFIVLTHQHLHDESIVRFCLGKPFRYLGLISSRTKWATFSRKYREEGFREEQLARIATPIGLDIGAETPFEIAVAIAGELIQLHRT